MSLSSFFRFLRRPTFRTHIKERPARPRTRFTLEFLVLEDRCLMSFTPLLPMAGTKQGDDKGLNSVVYTPEGDKGFNQANLPEKKLVTIQNNSSTVVYPIFYGANSTVDKTAGQVVRITLDNVGSGFNTKNKEELWPKVVITNLTRAIPEADRAVAKVKVDGDGHLYGLELVSGGKGYDPNDKLEVTFDDSANGNQGKGATAEAFISKYDKNYALYDPMDGRNQTYRGYIGEKNSEGKYELGLLPGHQATVQLPIAFWDGGRLYFATNGALPLQRADDPGNPLQNNKEWFFDPAQPSYVVAPSDSEHPTPYSANFPDPVTDEANENAMVLWYHNPAEANDFGFGTPAQLTEMTFRDQKQFHIAPDMPGREVDMIVNYDVSYVDSLAMPAAMEGTNVPLRGGPKDAKDLTPGQFAWLGSDMSVTEMQQYIAAFTTVNITPKAGESGPNGLGTYFGGLGYDQYYMPPENAAGGKILTVRNLKGERVQLIVPVSGALHEGSTIVIDGVKGQTELNNTWVITEVASSSTETNFFLKGVVGNGENSTGGTYAAKSTAVALQKLPAGYQVISDSANQNVQSGFDATKYSLVSGGTKVTVDTLGTGDATAGSAEIKKVNADQAALLVPGMLWSPVNTPGPDGKPYFPNGTTIAKIIPGTPGNNDATIVMTNPANFPRSKESWTYSGSQFASNEGEIAANGNKITKLDPKVGIYLRPGMLVIGDQIPAGTYIDTAPGSISADFTEITLTKSIGTTKSTGPYTFTGESYSYVVRKLIDVWYGWADYYARQLNDSGPNQAPSGSFSGTTTANKNREDQNSLLLKITEGSFNMDLLRVGDVVTGTAGTLTPNTSDDPSLNYTITKINKTARTVELSLPVAVRDATTAVFSFAPPKYIVRSKDAPMAPGTAGTIPYTLDFSSGTAAQQKSALDFARTVYDVMQSFSLLIDPDTLMSRSALLLRYSIGGNVGSFTTNDEFADRTGRHTTLPHDRTHVELRDEIKSILRGVFDFLDPTVADPVNWYPDPAVPTPGATLDKGSGPKSIDFGVYNLNPYVWFVHTQLKMSGYGFSLDDDVANTTANTSSIEIAFGGNAYTAPVNTTKTPPDPIAPDLVNLEAYTGGAKFGTQQSQGFIQGSKATPRDFPGETRISGLSLEVVLKLVASTKSSDPIGALITGLGLPPGVTIAHTTPLNPVNKVDQSWVTFKTPENWTPPVDDQPLTQFTFSGFKTQLPQDVTPTTTTGKPGSTVAIKGSGFDGVLGVTFNGIPATMIQGAITGIVNDNGALVTIKTSNTKGLIEGDTITISGMKGQKALNRQWIVTNVVGDKSFQLKGSSGNGDVSSGGNWIAGTDSSIKVIVPSYQENKNGTTYPGPTGKVGVRTPSGTNYSSLFFTIGNPGNPTFSGIGQPGSATASGSLKSTVTLYGSGFSGTSAVTFDGSTTPVDVYSANPTGTELKITIPDDASGTGTFTLTVGGTTYTSTGYTFTVNKPVIAASNPFTPDSGPIGTVFTIKGSGFTGADDPDTGGVTINGTPATHVTVIDDKTITVRVAAGTTSGQVVVKTAAGTGDSGANQFNVTAYQTPTVASATPNPASVGALIRLTGTNFTGVNQAGGGITFGGVAATVIKVIDNQNIDVEVPAGVAPGSAPIIVTNPGPLSSTPFAFTVIAATKPVIVSFSPGSGEVGDRVTIQGSGFTKATKVLFGITQAGFTVQDDGTITATVPSGAVTGLITVRNDLGEGTSSTSFVVGVQPDIKSFSPESGAAGTEVKLFGKGFTSVTHVKFNGVDATKFTVTDDDEMTAIVPIGATTGRISVSTASGHAASSATDFTVTTIVKPIVDSFSPEKGPTGSKVTIKGTGFTGTSKVTFNGVAASIFNVVDDKTIEVTVPNLATTGLIGVTNAADTGYSQKNFVVESANVPAAIVVVSGTPQSAPLNTAFAAPLKVKVTDSSGAPLGNINVTFTAPTGGASGKFANGGTTVTVATDANGIATSPVFTANSVSGAYSVTANVTPALSTPATFALTNTKADVNQTYIEALFTAFVNRKPSEAEMSQWLGVLNTRGRAAAVDGIMRTTDAATRVVASLFQRMLNRTGGDQATWINKLVSGVSIDLVIAGIAGTNDFAARAKELYPTASANDAFVKALFSILMNREATSAEIANYSRRVTSLGREGVAKLIVVLPEFRTGAVRTFFGDPTLKPLPYQPFFLNLLQRKAAPTAAEVDTWVKSGQGLSAIEAAFAASDEYFKLVTGSSAPTSLAATTQARVVRRPGS